MTLSRFIVSLGASALHRLFSTGWCHYLVRNRRYYALSIQKEIG